MKTKNFVGLFQGKEKPKKISNSLVIAGFETSSIITEENTNDVFLLSVSVKDHYEMQTAKNIFDYYRPHHVYEFKFEIKNGEELRNLVDSTAKVEVYSTPEIKHHNHYHEGISSEVKFGH